MTADRLRIFQPDLFDDEPPPDRRNDPLVSEILAWHEQTHPQPATDGRERRRIWKAFAVEYGHRPVAKCRSADLFEFISRRKGLKSNWTRKRWAATINRPFNEAARMGLIRRNPFAGIRWPAGDSGRDWTDEEYRKMLRHANRTMRRVLVFLRYAGCRPGELREMQWPDLVPESAVIVLRKHKTAKRVKKPRRIYLNHITIGLLAAIKRHNPSPATHIFVNSFGRPWTMRALDKALERLRSKAGLPKDVKLHGGRHTWITQAILRTGDLATVAVLAGHESVKTTERYTHLIDKHEHLKQAAEAAIGKKMTPSMKPRVTDEKKRG